MTETLTSQAVAHPMARFQRQVQSLVNKSKVVKPEDPIWKIAFLFGEDWAYWRKELEDFEFSVQDPIRDLLAVDTWEE
jgi:hypothetical protein